MEAIPQIFHTQEPAHPGLNSVKTTLYELIEAIGQEVKPGEDELVEETVMHLFDTGQVRFLDDAFEVKGSC